MYLPQYINGCHEYLKIYKSYSKSTYMPNSNLLAINNKYINTIFLHICCTTHINDNVVLLL